MIPSLEGWPTNAKVVPSPHEIRLASLDANPVFQSLEGVRLALLDTNPGLDVESQFTNLFKNPCQMEDEKVAWHKIKTYQIVTYQVGPKRTYAKEI